MQTAATSNEHFEILLVILAACLTGIGWLIKRTMARSDKRYNDLVIAVTSTNLKLGEVAEGLANVVGQLSVVLERDDRDERKYNG